MAGRNPFFITGANAKIKLNGRVIAYCTDVSYRISVKHASPRVLGRFEVEVNQPLQYDVSGSLTVIRYAKGAISHVNNAPPGVAGKGNGIGQTGLGSFGGALGSALGLPTPDLQFDGKADEAFVPSRMFQSSMFDIEIIQKLGRLNPETETPEIENCAIAILRDCRLTESSFSMSKKTAATQTFSFIARYADEDSFIARKSGVGQELT